MVELFLMKLANKGFTLIEVLISAAIIVTIASIAIPQVIRTKMTANESLARSTLKTISTALESYAGYSQQGTYPAAIADLVTPNPPFLSRNYIADSPIRGYNYTCDTLGAGGYDCSAAPEVCNQTGSKTYTVTTGCIFTEADCS